MVSNNTYFAIGTHVLILASLPAASTYYPCNTTGGFAPYSLLLTPSSFILFSSFELSYYCSHARRFNLLPMQHGRRIFSFLFWPFFILWPFFSFLTFQPRRLTTHATRPTGFLLPIFPFFSFGISGRCSPSIHVDLLPMQRDRLLHLFPFFLYCFYFLFRPFLFLLSC